tara:strand:+ start:47 stop:250 length:204 start_codon:yes stop_codon:yes gene_type:complete
MDLIKKEEKLIQLSENNNFLDELNYRIDNDNHLDIDVIDINRENNIKFLMIIFMIFLLIGCKKNNIF